MSVPERTRAEAEELALVVEMLTGFDVELVSDDRGFVVDVLADSGRYTLVDERDWGWLGPKIGKREPLARALPNHEGAPTAWRWSCDCGESAGGRWLRSHEEAMKAVFRHRERCPLTKGAARPDGYIEPFPVYLVELTDEEGDACFGQLGVFTVEAEAQKLVARCEGEGRMVRLNVVNVHERWIDYEYDR